MIILLSSDDNPKTAIVKQVITGNNKREKTSHTIEEFSIERLSIYIPVVDTTTTTTQVVKDLNYYINTYGFLVDSFDVTNLELLNTLVLNTESLLFLILNT